MGKENPARKQAGDWSCPTCKAHCFASRSSCFKCGTQNPNNVTVTFLAEHVFTGKGKQDVIAKAKTDFAVQQQKERKQRAALRKFEQQQLMRYMTLALTLVQLRARVLRLRFGRLMHISEVVGLIGCYGMGAFAKRKS